MLHTQDVGSPGPAGRALQDGLTRRSLFRYAGLGAAALGATSLLVACGGPGATAGGGLADKFPIASVPGDSFLLDSINVANKDYAKHQLDVPKHIVPSSGVQGFQLLLADAISGMGADTLNLLSTHANTAKGKRPVLVGLRTTETIYGIVGSKGGNWPGADASFEEKMRSLKGKRIGVPSIGSGGDLQLKLALEEAGMTYGDVTPLAVGLAAQAIPNLNAGRIDAYVTVQWTSARYVAQETGGPILIDFADPKTPEFIRDQAVVAIAVREDTALQNPELVQRWLATQDDARQWMLNNRAEAADILNKTGLGGNGAEIAASYIDYYASTVSPKLGTMFKADQKSVEHMINIGLRFGNFKKGDITYEDLVPEFARA